MDYTQLASTETIEKTITALKTNGIDAYFVENGDEAKKKLAELIPAGASIMDMTSMTLDTVSIATEINESGRYDSVRKKLMSMDQKTQGGEMRKLGAAPDIVVGSVHAVTEDGTVMIASATGSQLPAYAYGASKVIWIVGVQKIVKDREDGFRRVYEHTLPLESERAKKAYGVPGSSVNKMLIVNKEAQPGRIAIVFVNQALGF